MTSDRTYTPAQMADAVQRMIDDGTYMPWDLLPKLVAYLRDSAPGAAEMREAAIEAHRHLQTWLDADACDCEFETGHVCGRVQVAATVKRLEAAICALPAREVPE